MLCRRRRGLGQAMKHRMVMAGVTLSRETGGHYRYNKDTSTNRATRLRHKEGNDTQPHLILGHPGDHWEGAS